MNTILRLLAGAASAAAVAALPAATASGPGELHTLPLHAVAVIGILRLVTSGSACLTQVNSSFPFGTHVLSCAQPLDAVDLLDRGTVCVGPGGRDACDPQEPQPPHRDGDGPYAGAVGAPIQFDGTGSWDDGIVTSYLWQFGDGQASTGQTPTHPTRSSAATP